MLQAAVKPADLDPDHWIGDQDKTCIPLEGFKSYGAGLDPVGMLDRASRTINWRKRLFLLQLTISRLALIRWSASSMSWGGIALSASSDIEPASTLVALE